MRIRTTPTDAIDKAMNVAERVALAVAYCIVGATLFAAFAIASSGLVNF